MDDKKEGFLTVHIEFEIPYPKLPVKRYRDLLLWILAREQQWQQKEGDKTLSLTQSSRILLRAFDFHSINGRTDTNSLKTIRNIFSKFFRKKE